MHVLLVSAKAQMIGCLIGGGDGPKESERERAPLAGSGKPKSVKSLKSKVISDITNITSHSQ